MTHQLYTRVHNIAQQLVSLSYQFFPKHLDLWIRSGSQADARRLTLTRESIPKVS